MLDLDHPLTPHVFAASRQIDLILDYAKRITFSDSNGRIFMAQVVAPSFAALRWLNDEKFNASTSISERIDALEIALHELANRCTTPTTSPFDRQHCPVCNQSLTVSNEHEPVPYCPGCLKHIIPALTNLRDCDEGFGTEAI